MQILEDLYIGNVRPGERMFKRNSQYAKALVKESDITLDWRKENESAAYQWQPA